MPKLIASLILKSMDPSLIKCSGCLSSVQNINLLKFSLLTAGIIFLKSLAAEPSRTKTYIPNLNLSFTSSIVEHSCSVFIPAIRYAFKSLPLIIGPCPSITLSLNKTSLSNTLLSPFITPG